MIAVVALGVLPILLTLPGRFETAARATKRNGG
jgi:hypothetical protein